MERIIQALSCNEILGEHLQNQCNEAFQNRTHHRSYVADGVYVHRTYIWMCLCVCVLQQPRPVLLSQPKQIHHFKVIHYISCMPDILDVYQLIVHTQATSNKQPHRIVYKLQIIIIATDHHISGPLSLSILYNSMKTEMNESNLVRFLLSRLVHCICLVPPTSTVASAGIPLSTGVCTQSTVREIIIYHCKGISENNTHDAIKLKW